MFRRILPLLAVAWAAGCGDPSAPVAVPAEKFPGAVLTLALDKAAPIADPLALRIPEWEDRTGAKVQIVDAAQATAPDLWAVSAARLPGLPALRPLGPSLLNDSDVLFIQFPYAYRNCFAARDSVPVALPLTTERLLLWCREDFYRDPALQAAWAKSGGTAAAFGPPKTWPDYLKQAEFFRAQGAVKHGVAEAADGGVDAVRNFLARAQGYAAAPRQVPIDPETGAPELASPECLRAAADWRGARALGTGGDALAARRAFAAGTAAFLLSTVPPTIDPGPQVLKGLAEKCLPALLPAATETYDRATKKWLPAAEPRSLVHYAGAGHVVAVAAGSPHGAAGESLLKFLGSGAQGAYVVQGARRGLVPLRGELLTDSSRFESYSLSARHTSAFFELVRSGIRAESYAADLRCPGAADLHAALGAALEKIAGGADPAAALGVANANWQTQIQRGGLAWQAEFRASLGLPPRAQ
jgi:hypothetical protein